MELEEEPWLCELLELFAVPLAEELLDTVFSELLEFSPELLESSEPLELLESSEPLELLESSELPELLEELESSPEPESMELLESLFPSSLFSPEQAKKIAHIAMAARNKTCGILFIESS